MDTTLQHEGRTVGRARFVPAYGLAALRAGWSVLRELQVQDLHGTLHLRIPEIHYLEEFDAASGRRVEQHAPERIAAMEEALEAVMRPRSLIGHVEWNGERLGGAPITVLPPWSWPLFAEARVLSAAFVLPGEDATERLAAEVRARHDTSSSDVSTRLLAAYGIVAAQCALRYEAPRLQSEPWSGCVVQSIRPAADLWATFPRATPVSAVATARSDPGAVGATCLDLSLALAGVLEALGDQPLLVFVGEREAPEHVVVGAWSQAARRFRPLIDDAAALQRAVSTGALTVVESTGVCRGESRLDGAAAKAAAMRRIQTTASLVAVDVCAARPPAGVVAPLWVANSPEVAQALASARELADRLGVARSETVHLLYGLCRAAGELTQWLLEARGSSTEAVARRIEALQPRTADGGPSVPTRNHLLCLSTARGNARSRGATSVAEGDLLWAVLENPSSTVRRVLEEEGCRLSRLQRELGTRFERPGLSTSLSWTAPQSSGSWGNRPGA